MSDDELPTTGGAQPLMHRAELERRVELLEEIVAGYRDLFGLPQSLHALVEALGGKRGGLLWGGRGWPPVPEPAWTTCLNCGSRVRTYIGWQRFCDKSCEDRWWSERHRLATVDRSTPL